MIWQRIQTKGKTQTLPVLRRKIRRRNAIVANTCLLVWAVLLTVIGMQAVSGKASTVILEIAEAFVPEKQPQASASPTPTPTQDSLTLMSEYIEKKYAGKEERSIPPLSVVLDRLQVGVNWRDATAIDEVNGNLKPPTDDDYKNLFDIVAKRLEAIADFSPEVSIGGNLTISNNIMPLKFRSAKSKSKELESDRPPEFKELEIDLPVEAVLWVKARQASVAARKTQISFLDLFVLLIILGGFGSWVYLVRRHVDPKITPRLYEYFYRPPLGMTLAIAVFIVNITLHSFVSNSNINEVRRETLILLAFTAGLLSDKTYEFIEKATGEKLGHKENEP